MHRTEKDLIKQLLDVQLKQQFEERRKALERKKSE